MTIETTHLRLLAYAPDHLLALIEGPARFQERFGFPAADGLRDFIVSDEVSHSYLARLRSHSEPDPWLFGLAVLHRELALVIGSAGFKGPPGSDEVVEIAYAVVPAFEGRGFATEVAGALTAFAFADDRVKRVRAHTLPEPNASSRVLEKCGFTRVGEVQDPEDGLVWRWERAGPV